MYGGAERDVVERDRLGLEHRVEGRDLVRPHRRYAQVLGDRGDQLVAQPAAVGLLGGEQALDHGRALAVGRELGDPVVDVRAHVVGQRDHRVDVARILEISGGLHRSTSPNTMSYVPIIATPSARMFPFTTSSIEYRTSVVYGKRVSVSVN